MAEAADDISMPIAAADVGGPITLHDAIRVFSAPDRWNDLLQVAGGKESDIIELLSGRHAGNFLLLHQTVSRNFYAEADRERYKAVLAIANELIDNFNGQRQTLLLLKGVTSADPGKRIAIGRELPLEYDFARDTVRSGELTFHGVTVTRRQSTEVKTPVLRPVAAEELRSFCQTHIAAAETAPSMDALEAAARKAFPGHRISRSQIRDLHRDLVPAEARKPGPRLKRH